MKKANAGKAISNIDVLKTISDQISMDIITAISNGVTNSEHLMQILDLTHKQYHSRSSRLLNIGIINRKDGGVILTSFGRLIYNAQTKIAAAFSHSSELRLIDAIKSHSGMSEDQQKSVIDKLIDNSDIKDLIA